MKINGVLRRSIISDVSAALNCHDIGAGNDERDRAPNTCRQGMTEFAVREALWPVLYMRSYPRPAADQHGYFWSAQGSDRHAQLALTPTVDQVEYTSQPGQDRGGNSQEGRFTLPSGGPFLALRATPRIWIAADRARVKGRGKTLFSRSNHKKGSSMCL